MQHFSELKVWQKSHALVLNLYRLTTAFSGRRALRPDIAAPTRSSFGPTNIAEGTKRRGKQDYARFLNIAEGSLSETEYLLRAELRSGLLAAEGN